jgi:hypothetical protein
VANQHTTKGQPKRTRVVSVRYTPPEHETVLGLASEKQQELSEYIRGKSLEEARTTTGKGRVK